MHVAALWMCSWLEFGLEKVERRVAPRCAALERFLFELSFQIFHAYFSFSFFVCCCFASGHVQNVKTDFHRRCVGWLVLVF